MIAEWFQRACRRASIQFPNPRTALRMLVWRMRGASFGSGTGLPRALATWPHQVVIGSNCILQPDIFFNYDHYWTEGPSIKIGNRVFIGRGVEFNIQGGIEVGDDCLIASGCFFVDHDHGKQGDELMNRQGSIIQPISIARNVWIGANVSVLKGVSIGEGAVIAAGAVVNKPIPAGELWGGVPAKPLKRFTSL